MDLTRRTRVNCGWRCHSEV